MTTEDIQSIAMIAKMKDGTVLQILLDSKMKNLYLDMVYQLEGGINLLEKPLEGIIIETHEQQKQD